MIDSYSGFGSEGEETGLAEILRDHNVKETFLCGLAFDYCVGWTALGSVASGFKTYVIGDATRAVAKDSEAAMLKKLNAADVIIVNTKELDIELSIEIEKTPQRREYRLLAQRSDTFHV